MTTETATRTITLGERELPLNGLVLVCGNPRSGKSTFVNYVVNAAGFDNVLRVTDPYGVTPQDDQLVIAEDVDTWDTQTVVEFARRFVRAQRPLILSASDVKKFPLVLRDTAVARVVLDSEQDTAFALIERPLDILVSNHTYLLSVDGIISAGQLRVDN